MRQPTDSTAETTAADGGFRWPVRQFSLDNGLRVVVCEDRTGPIAGVNLWYDVGSRHEPAGKHGFAHLFEHLMFQGSAQVGKTEHFSVLQEVGGSAINATTSADRTNYYQTVPSAALPTALWLEADRMGSLALTQENLDNQREVVKNERRQRYDNVPYGRWAEILLALAYPEGHPYHHSTIGSMAELDSAEQSDFTAFYESYYSPDNAVLTVVGDADDAQVRRFAEEYFGGLSARPRPEPAAVAALPAAIDGPVHEVIEEPVPLPRFFFGFRATRFGEPGAAAEEVLAAVLGRGRGARLFTELVTKRELAQAEGSYLASWQLAWYESLLSGMVTPRPGVDAAELHAAYFEVCERAAVDAPTEAELDRARSMLEADWARELSSVGARADQLSRHAVLFGDAERVRDRLPELLAVTAEDVRAAAERIFTPGNRVTLEYRPVEVSVDSEGN
ncbi:pitrilysin family protein [Actinospica sp.]|uniref:M16 family metallopeptidase n=1 Tax=Actinospica sp. TaxID=1872142 RepID=UPI002C18EC0B|nr:pitrilysin family protein [Actinospica sp.]HWG24610.1 pitrilysin family protein [Actinospica sp.]